MPVSVVLGDRHPQQELAAERRSNADMTEIRAAAEGAGDLSMNPGVDELDS